MKAPKAPDPYATAQAQSQMNKDTANYQSGLNMVNQVTPYGNLTYSGVNNGQPGSATATTSLSPFQQQLLDQSQQADYKMNNIGLNQIDRVGDILSKPVDLSNRAVEDWIYSHASPRMTSQFAQQGQNMEQDLINRGVTMGSEAYNNAHELQNQRENDAWNQLYLNGRQQGVQEMLTSRNQPLNEITALLNGQQISLPQFVNTPQSQVANTDLMGAVNDAYKQKVSQYNAGMGGLFGLGGTLLKGAMSLPFGGAGAIGAGTSTLW